jgi:iron complex transport system substrate-binding protein
MFSRSTFLTRLGVFIMLLIALVLPARAEIVVTDVAGREVRLAEPASRILIDDGRYLVALALIHPDPVSVLSAWPKDIHRIGPAYYRQFVERFPAIENLMQSASSATNFSVEQVLAAEPDLAIFSLQSQPSPEEISQIERAGIPVAIIDFFNHPLRNSEQSFRLLGAVTKREEQAEAFIKLRADRIETIRGRLEADASSRPSVMLEPHAARTEECCPSPGKGNIGDYITLTGGDNIGADVIKGITGVLNLEFVIEANPDVYIATGGPHMEGTQGLLIGPGYDEATIRSTLERVVSRPGISGLKAVGEGRAYGLAHQLLNSPLDILTIETLASWIRPGLFSDIHPEETMKLLNERFLAVPLTDINWIALKQ